MFVVIVNQERRNSPQSDQLSMPLPKVGSDPFSVGYLALYSDSVSVTVRWTSNRVLMHASGQVLAEQRKLQMSSESCTATNRSDNSCDALATTPPPGSAKMEGAPAGTRSCDPVGDQFSNPTRSDLENCEHEKVSDPRDDLLMDSQTTVESHPLKRWVTSG